MIIGLTGRIASGKAIVRKFLENKEFIYCTFSDVIREEAARRGIPIIRKDLQNLGNKVRQEEGGGAWTKYLINKMEPGKNYIVDGIRNPGEVYELKKAKEIGNFYLIAIDAPQKIRFQRLIERARPSDPKTWEGFLDIDKRDFGENEPEYGQQVGKSMELADYRLNNESGQENFIKEIQKIYENILERE